MLGCQRKEDNPFRDKNIGFEHGNMILPFVQENWLCPKE